MASPTRAQALFELPPRYACSAQPLPWLSKCLGKSWEVLLFASCVSSQDTDETHLVFLSFRIQHVHLVSVIWLIGASYAGRDLDFGTKAAIQEWRITWRVSEGINQSVRGQHVFPV